MSHLEHFMKYTGYTGSFAPSRTLDCECEDDTLYYYDGEELIGQVSLFIEDHRVNLFDVVVMPELRNQGYGREMLHHFLTEEWPYLAEIFPIEERSRELVLQVSESNGAALHLYLLFGFDIIESVSWDDELL